MGTSYYYTTQNQEHGPVTMAQLKQLVQKGILHPDDTIRLDGQSQMYKAQGLPGLFPDIPAKEFPQSSKKMWMTTGISSLLLFLVIGGYFWFYNNRVLMQHNPGAAYKSFAWNFVHTAQKIHREDITEVGVDLIKTDSQIYPYKGILNFQITGKQYRFTFLYSEGQWHLSSQEKYILSYQFGVSNSEWVDLDEKETKYWKPVFEQTPNP